MNTMTPASNKTLAELEVARGVSVKEIDEALDEIWRTLQSNPNARNIFARRMDIEPSELIWDRRPFVAQADVSEIDFLTAIAISVAAHVGLRLSDKLIDKLFDVLLWPEIERRLGDKVKRRAS